MVVANNSFNITSPGDLQYTITGLLRNESCDGSCNGQISVNLSGGPLHIQIIHRDKYWNSINFYYDSDSILGDMCSGIWSVVLTDANGCSSSLLQEELVYRQLVMIIKQYRR